MSHFEAYKEHASSLRTWFVTYGVGAPAFLLSQDALRTQLKQSGETSCLAALLLIGVAAQVFIVALNKTIMWACYYAEEKVAFKSNRLFRAADLLSRQFWLDLGADIASLVCFSMATWKMFSVFA